MKIAKSFIRNGELMRPGDPAPDDLDAETIRHYRRHGMVTDAEETDLQSRQSAAPPSRSTNTPRKPRVPAPTNTQTLAPQQASTVSPSEGQGAGPLNAEVLALTNGAATGGPQDGSPADKPTRDAKDGASEPPVPPSAGGPPADKPTGDAQEGASEPPAPPGTGDQPPPT